MRCLLGSRACDEVKGAWNNMQRISTTMQISRNIVINRESFAPRTVKFMYYRYSNYLPEFFGSFFFSFFFFLILFHHLFHEFYLFFLFLLFTGYFSSQSFESRGGSFVNTIIPQLCTYTYILYLCVSELYTRNLFTNILLTL